MSHTYLPGDTAKTKVSFWRRCVPLRDPEGRFRWVPRQVTIVRYRWDMMAYECYAHDGTWFFTEERLQ